MRSIFGHAFKTIILFINLVCMTPSPALALDCNQPPSTLDGSDSKNHAYFVDLLQRAQTAPISDFLKLWYPEHDQKVDRTYFLDCRDSNYVLAVTRPGCAPDILYSWQPWSKLTAIRSMMPDGEAWEGRATPTGSNIWATVSAVSTYSYGGTVIRLKIKPDAVYAPGFSSGAHQIAYGSNFGLQDYILSDSDVIESYSFDTPELYDEVVKDILRISSGQSFMGYKNNVPAGATMNNVYNAGTVERGPQTEEVLRARLTLMLQMILGNKGQIVYSQGVCRSREAAYQTAKPTYINTYNQQK